MKEIMLKRYSCRKFSGEKLNDDTVKEIIDLTRLSPSSCGLEPWLFIVISKDEEIEKIGDICLKQPQVLGCSHAVIVVSRNDLTVGCGYLDKTVRRRANTPEKYEKAMQYFKNKFDGWDNDKLNTYAAKQCYIATGNLVNIAESFNVKSCIIAGYNPEKLRKYIWDECGLDERFEPVLVVALGKAEDIKFPHTRHPLSDNLIWK